MIGTIAGIFTTIAFVPQVFKTVKSKEASSLSFTMVALQVIGISLWLAHGIAIHDFALIAANTLTCLLTFVLFMCKLKYK